MINRIVFVLAICLFLLSCKSKTPDNRYNSIFIDTSKVDFKIIDSKIINDSLIVTTSSYIYFPFGYYHNLKDFSEVFPFMNTYNDTIKHLFNFSFKKSSIKLLFDENNCLQIVAAKIHDPEIVLYNKVRVGMTKTDFINSYAFQFNSEQINKAKVVKMISAATGIWHYYIFKGDILSYFYFETDYIIQ